MERPLTSEEKLLKFIRKKGKGPKKEAPAPEQPLSESTVVVDKPGPKRDTILVLRALNRILLIVALGLFGYVFYTNFSGKAPESPVVQRDVMEDDVPASANVNLASVQLEPQPFSYYEQELTRRDLFQQPWEKTEGDLIEPSMASSDIAKYYKLVGIVLDDEPQAILENTQDNETFFVTIGQQIGTAKLEDITESKVVFVDNGERIELTQ